MKITPTNNKEKGEGTGMLRAVFALVSGNTVAMAVGFLISPLLTRLFSPDEFGVLNLFLSISGVLILFANAEFHNSIMLPKSEYKAVACTHLGMLTTMAACLLFLLGVILFFSLDFEVGPIGNWLWLIPIYAFLQAIWNILNNWYTRTKHFWLISSFQVSQSLGNAALKSLFGWLKLPHNGLISGTIIGSLIALVLSVATSLKQLRPLLRFDGLACKVMALRYVNFPKYSLPRALVNYVSGNLPILLLSAYFSMDYIGFFGMATMLAFRPINMISYSLCQVFYQKSAEMYRDHKPLMPFFRRFSKNTLMIVVPSFLALYYILPWLVSFLFGEEWVETGTYIQMMLPWLAMSTIVASMGFLFDLFLMQKMGLIFEIINIVMRLLSLGYGIWVDDFSTAILVYCLSNFVVICVQYIWYYRIIRKYDNSLSDLWVNLRGATCSNLR
ncbi:MAG: oligosaccharide flippase family protein [Paludibacteraceae bacterium]|nr:oligosaccharide flippase family protein [Paludibacteraceae bacterium]